MNPTDVIGIVGTALAGVLVLGTTIGVLLNWVRGLISDRISDIQQKCEDYRIERDFWKDESLRIKEEMRENAKRNADNQENTARSLKSIETFLEGLVKR